MRSPKVSAFAGQAIRANVSAAIVPRIRLSRSFHHCEERLRRSNPCFRKGIDGLLRGACHRARIRATRWLAMTYDDYLLTGNLLLAVGDAIDGAVPVVGNQQRAVLHLH